MRNLLRIAPLLLGAGAALTGCGNHDGKVAVTPPPATPPVAAVLLPDKVGSAFSAIFNANPNSEPRDPSPTDVPPLNLTAEPLDQ